VIVGRVEDDSRLVEQDASHASLLAPAEPSPRTRSLLPSLSASARRASPTSARSSTARSSGRQQPVPTKLKSRRTASIEQQRGKARRGKGDSDSGGIELWMPRVEPAEVWMREREARDSAESDVEQDHSVGVPQGANLPANLPSNLPANLPSNLRERERQRCTGSTRMYEVAQLRAKQAAMLRVSALAAAMLTERDAGHGSEVGPGQRHGSEVGPGQQEGASSTRPQSGRPKLDSMPAGDAPAAKRGEATPHTQVIVSARRVTISPLCLTPSRASERLAGAPAASEMDEEQASQAASRAKVRVAAEALLHRMELALNGVRLAQMKEGEELLTKWRGRPPRLPPDAVL